MRDASFRSDAAHSDSSLRLKRCDVENVLLIRLKLLLRRDPRVYIFTRFPFSAFACSRTPETSTGNGFRSALSLSSGSGATYQWSRETPISVPGEYNTPLNPSESPEMSGFGAGLKEQPEV